MSNNNTLSAEVQNEIWEKAKAYARSYGRKEIGYYSLNYKAGATEWANKWWELRDQTKQLMHKYALLQNELQQSKQLLSKFISRHEAGLLPDMFIYNEIKQFLDGK
mgnify:CR=1 FL=1